MTRIESLLGCAALLGSLGVALYAGEARSETPPIYCPGIIVPTVYGALVCTTDIQFGGGTAAGPAPASRTVTVSPPTPPTPPTPPSDNCGPKGEGGHHGHHGGKQ